MVITSQIVRLIREITPFGNMLRLGLMRFFAAPTNCILTIEYGEVLAIIARNEI